MERTDITTYAYPKERTMALTETQRDEITTLVGNALSALDDAEWREEQGIPLAVDYTDHAVQLLCSALRILEPETYSDR